jgi:hypothetical protein
MRVSSAARERLVVLERDLRVADDVADFEAINDVLLQQILLMAPSSRLVTALRRVTSIVPGNVFAEVPGTLAPQRRGVGRAVRAISARDHDTARHVFEHCSNSRARRSSDASGREVSLSARHPERP